MRNRTMDRLTLFLKTLDGEVIYPRPVWLMRQAGRFLKPYRDLRDRYDFLTMCTTPEIAAEVTVMPQRELGVDALVLFSDILIPLLAIGAKLKYADGYAPIVENIDINNLGTQTDLESIEFVAETIRLVKSLAPDYPLIGFAASPFTLACYLFGSQDEFSAIRAYIYAYPDAFLSLMDRLSNLTVEYLRMQVAAGCDAVQIFDSWAGILTDTVYSRFVFPYVDRIATAVDAKTIYYIKNSRHLRYAIKELGVNCLSVDWREDLMELHRETGKVVQGNLDNTLLLTDRETLIKHVERLLGTTVGIAHIVNLGHGVLPSSNPDLARLLVDVVHNFDYYKADYTDTGG